MPKLITLPIGLPPENVDIGTLAFVSGRNYNASRFDALSVSNLILGLGERISSVNIKSLLTSNNINKWAAFKPYASGVNGTGLSISNFDWIYNKPTDQSGYDVSHFFGYNHNAPTPSVISVSTITFSTTGTKTGQLILRLPEFDLRDFASITHIAVKTYQGVNYSTLTHELVTELTSELLGYGSLGLDFQVTCSSLANTDFKIVVELGYMGTNPVAFNKTANYPSNAGGVFQQTGTAIYSASYTLSPLQPINSDITPTPSQFDIYTIDTVSVNLNTSTMKFSWTFALFKEPDQSGDRTQKSGSATVRLRNPSTGDWYSYGTVILSSSSNTSIVNGSIPAGISFSDITSNIEIKLTNINLS